MIWMGLFLGLFVLLPWATYELLGVYREYQVARLATKGGGTFKWMGIEFTVTEDTNGGNE